VTPRKVLVCVVSVCLALASSAFAAGTVTYLEHGLGNSPGGEFIFQTSGIPGYDGSQLKTFCLEWNEYIWKGGTYNVDIGKVAKQGGVGGFDASLGGDPLDPKTAYLYYHYSQHDLVGWTNDQDSANALQYAIWYLEDETTLPLNAGAMAKANTFLADASTSGWKDTGPVWVLNLYYSWPGCGNIPCQDQLILLPPVPVPASILIGLIGLFGLGTVRRHT